MISKEFFVKVINLIKEQEKIDREVAAGLSKVCDGYIVFGTNNKEHQALMMLLNDIFKDEEDYISWWLYDSTDKRIWETVNGVKIVYDVSSPENFYDFLVKNSTESIGS